MSVHTLSRIQMSIGTLAQAKKQLELRGEGAARRLMREVRDLLTKELDDDIVAARPRRTHKARTR